jgi:predicted tellurium resistance membrane protein TerC
MVVASRWLVIAAGILAVIGLIVNASVDLDNIYDMTTSGLFLITLILAFVGASIMSRERKVERTLPPEQQQRPKPTV